tara:strand:- start:36 stop:737 length:702 start_codon:yes stop_codon:yes gene_type:complete
MKVVILCGGKGTRLAEETNLNPKPMVKIGDKPIIWHILKFFNHYGHNEFILATGYKNEVINDFFYNNKDFPNVKTIFTGAKTMTGGRILRLKSILDKEEEFFMTYGDGVTNLNLNELLKFHKSHNKIATVTAVHPPVRFGEVEINKNQVTNFAEKKQAKSSWISGGFFILNKKIFNYIKNDETVFEEYPLEKITSEGQLMAYKHEGFWQCMDTLREKKLLDDLWYKGVAPWKV